MNKKSLGFGLMRLPMADGKVDISLCCEMADRFMEAGGTYFDTALMYCGEQSESAVKEIVTHRYPRDTFTVATKLHAGFFNSLEDRDTVFNAQLERMGVDYFDYYLIHAIDRNCYEKYTRLDCFEWLKSKKAQGLVKHIGFSFHDSADFLEQVLTEHPEMEFVQLQLNYLDWDSDDVQSRLCYEVARKHGKPIIVMEPVKGGTLATLPPVAEELMKAAHPDWTPASWALRFVMELPGVMTVLSGMSNREQMLDNIATAADPVLLSEADHAIIRQVVAILRGQTSIPCTGCAYCVTDCPMNIPIPRCFSIYNEDQQIYGGAGKDWDGSVWTPASTYYDNLIKDHNGAAACIECGACAAHCPQHLDIPALLKDVAKRFGA
ncbi:MAG: aldo/keto reductase [Clostridia bacterium]|nr:aldo/keto reductase [Clostridia bacterium]